MARFHRYSWHNVMLIASQRPDATRVAGFHTWQQLGRFVKKGATGIMMLAPIVHKKGQEEGSDEELSRVTQKGSDGIRDAFKNASRAENRKELWAK